MTKSTCLSINAFYYVFIFCMTVIAPSFMHQSVYSVCLWVLCFKCVCMCAPVHKVFLVLLYVWSSLSLMVFLWVFLYYMRQYSLPLSAHLYVSPWFGSPLLSCLMLSRYGALVPGCLPAAVPCVRPQSPTCPWFKQRSGHPHPVGNLSLTQPWQLAAHPSLSLLFHTLFSPLALLSCPVFPWPRLSSFNLHYKTEVS